jgi:hypothetical protein
MLAIYEKSWFILFEKQRFKRKGSKNNASVAIWIRFLTEN